MSRYSFELSPIKAIELAASKLPGSVSLAQGIPSFSTPDIIKSFVYEKIAQGLCDKYSLTIGLAELREEIASALATEGLHYNPETEIIATCGSIEGISAAISSLTEPGDEVLIPSPSYVSYQGCAALARCNVKFVNLDEDNNYDFHVEAVERAVTKKTRVFLYASPNNPTGTIFSETKTRRLVEFLTSRGIYVLTDEVYKDFYYSNDRHFTPMSMPDVRSHCLRVCSFSKAYAMTGWRIGFIHGDHSLISRILPYHDAMVTCAPVVSQYAAIAALRHGESYVSAFREEFRRRRDYVLSRLDNLSHALDYQTPKAAYFVFPRIKDSIPLSRDSIRFTYDLLERVKLALVPGVAFGPSGEQHVRISFGREMADLEEGFNRLEEYLSGVRRSVKSPPLPTGPVPRQRSLVPAILSLCAKKFLSRQKVTTIGLVGLRGKTTFKRVLTEELSKFCNTRANPLSFNTAVGLPLAILNLQPPRTFWEKVIFPIKLFSRALFGEEAAHLLILEYGFYNSAQAEELLCAAVPDYLVLTGTETADPSINRADYLSGVERFLMKVAPQRTYWVFEETLRDRLPTDNRIDLGSPDTTELSHQRAVTLSRMLTKIFFLQTKPSQQSEIHAEL